MANKYAGEVITKITLDTGNLMKDITNNLKIAQQTVDKFQLNIDASLNTKQLNEEVNIAKNRLQELSKLKNEFNQNNKKFFNAAKFNMDTAYDDYLEGDISEFDFVKSVQNVLASGGSIDRLKNKIKNTYNEFNHLTGWIPLEDITSFDSLIIHTNAQIEALNHHMQSTSGNEKFEKLKKHVEDIDVKLHDLSREFSNMPDGIFEK